MSDLTPQERMFAFALKSYSKRSRKSIVRRQDLLSDHVFMTETYLATNSQTPGQQLSYIVQKLNRKGYVTMLERGKYRIEDTPLI